MPLVTVPKQPLIRVWYDVLVRVFIAYDKTLWPKASWEGKVLSYHTILLSHSNRGHKSEHTLKAGTEEPVQDKYCSPAFLLSMVWSDLLLLKHKTSFPWLVLLCLLSPPSSILNQASTDLSTGQSDGTTFLSILLFSDSYGFLLSEQIWPEHPTMRAGPCLWFNWHVLSNK